MRKAYSKPLLVAENFALSSSISSPCEGIAQNAEFACAVYIPDLSTSILGDLDMGCNEMPPNPEDSVCYHNPSDANNVYGS